MKIMVLLEYNTKMVDPSVTALIIPLKAKNVRKPGLGQRVSIMSNGQEDVRESIIKAAQEEFSRYGFRKTTMDEIAQAAKKGKSSIYHYFKSKEEIFAAVVEKEVREAKTIVDQALAKETTPQSKLEAYTVTRLEIFKKLVNLYNAYSDEYLEDHYFIEKLRINYDQYEIKMLKEILKGGIEEGVFVIKDLEMTAYAIVIAEKGLEYTWALEEDMEKIKSSVVNLLQVLFYGIVKR